MNFFNKSQIRPKSKQSAPGRRSATNIPKSVAELPAYSPRNNRGQESASRLHQTQAPRNEVWDPPPYTVSTSTQDPTLDTNAATRPVSDNPYAFLREFDTIFVVDDSLSMQGRRWKEAEEAIATITPICTQQDPDGIDLYFLNHRSAPSPGHRGGGYVNITSAGAVQSIFNTVKPSGATPFGRRLHQILDPYLKQLEDSATVSLRPLNIIAITDGVFTDDVETVVVQVARRLDWQFEKSLPWQVGIQFFQIGDDMDARQHLEELDDDLSARAQDGQLRDIVDTVPWKGGRAKTLSGDYILKIVLGAIHKKYDKWKDVQGKGFSRPPRSKK